jgi:hypothetical protein
MQMRLKTWITGATLALGLIAPGIATASAGAAPIAHPAHARADAEVTIVHGIPKVPVDVYVDGKKAIKDFTFGTVTPELAFKPGTYRIAIRPYGASPRSKPILAATEKLKNRENATIVADLTAAGKPALTVFANPTAAPGRHKARVIVRHVAFAPAVDVYARTTKIISHLTNPHQKKLVVPAPLTVKVSVKVAGTHTTVIGPVRLTFKARTTTIIYAIGSASGGSLTAVLQTY